MEKYNFENMAHHAADMVRKAIQSFVTRNRHLADEVREMDEDVDAMHRLVFKRVAEGMKQPGADTDQLIAVLSISRYIERMADHATRIALEVIYLVTGEIERHTDGSFEKIIQSLSD
jgi:phosphate transport system protein